MPPPSWGELIYGHLPLDVPGDWPFCLAPLCHGPTVQAVGELLEDRPREPRPPGSLSGPERLGMHRWHPEDGDRFSPLRSPESTAHVVVTLAFSPEGEQ